MYLVHIYAYPYKYTYIQVLMAQNSCISQPYSPRHIEELQLPTAQSLFAIVLWSWRASSNLVEMIHSSPTFNAFYSFSPSHEKRDPLADNHFGPQNFSHEYTQVPRGRQLTPLRSQSLVRGDFDKMVDLQMPATDLQAIYTRVVVDEKDRARFNNLYHEANADVRAIMSRCQHVQDFPFSLTQDIPFNLYQPRRHQRVLVLVDNICQMLGLANSHDTKATVPDKLLEDNQKACKDACKPWQL